MVSSRQIFFASIFLFLPLHVFAFDPSCFRESVTLSSSLISPFQIAIDSIEEDIFFVQDNTILASKLISTEKNPPIRYTILGIDDIAPIQDFDPKTQSMIDPYSLSQGDVTLNIDLWKKYEAGTISSIFDYSTNSKVNISASEDGKKYFSVDRSAVEDFALRFIRMTFEKVVTQNGPTVIRSIDFFEKVNMRFLVKSISKSEITAYRWLVCDRSQFPVPYLTDENPLSWNYTTIQFSKNLLYKNDYDQDGIENIADVCPYTSDSSQADRNYDGKWDACSDDDGDGIYGTTDNCPTVSNSDQADKNVNGIGDKCEFDTDGDSISDGIDNAIRVKNPDQKDTDYDGIGDVIDNCNLYNPDQLDLDKNGKGDFCDRDEQYQKTNDLDKDNILDFSDNCPKISNTDQSDSDRDGIGDVCDNCLLLQNPDQIDLDKNGKGDMCEDTDNDGIEWWRDNCPTLANPKQEDSNNDQIGDACSDSDSDGIYDSIDTCPLVYDKEQNDIDHDGNWDLCDNKDDRFLESNKYIFMGLITIFTLIFIGWILFLLRKMNPRNPS